MHLVQRAVSHSADPRRPAIITPERSYTYRDLIDASNEVAHRLLDLHADSDLDASTRDLDGARVAFLVPSGFEYVAVQWGVWRSGGIAVPLCTAHPRPELEYVIGDAGVEIVVAHPEYEAIVRPIAADRGLKYIGTGEALSDFSDSRHAIARRSGKTLPTIDGDRGALILYTSGTTSKPKGVLTTHRNIEAQVTSLIQAWEWSGDDHILHVLPLHHIHGIINVLTCALWAGARCRMLPHFDAEAVWESISTHDLTLFMAVPTIYTKLIAAWESAPPERQTALSAACRKLRLMVSGSAALPVSTLERWREISGHTLLERYGMTEIGMGISNPLHGDRRPGSVGIPLPGVEIKLVDERGRQVAPGSPGQIYVRGPGVFQAYWRRPEATRAAFDDGWFRTGDVAVLEEGYYRILGRESVDIIKTGGYKVSALEIEEVLRTHPDILECAVVGVPDPEWGERVSAAVIARVGADLSLEGLRLWAKERLAVYKVPTRLQVVSELPRNAMGKVTKSQVRALF